MSTVFKDQYESSHLQGANATYVEWLYEQFLADPGSVPGEWRQYFGSLAADGTDTPHGPIVQAVGRRLQRAGAPGAPAAAAAEASAPASEKQAAVSRLIQVYSLRGHQIADLDPLGLWDRPVPAVLSLDFLGLDESDMAREFYTGGLAGTGTARMKLQDILALLKRIYCGKFAAEFAHISRARERLWLREQFEACRVHWDFSAAEQTTILDSLTRAEGIERYLNTRFVGQKRFSLEGSETLIPLLDDMIQRAGEQGVQELVIGMAHRGRLNVLVNVLGKSPQDLFSEFEGAYDLARLKGSGDVKYHKGYSADVRTPGGNVHIALAFNPSHLEIVNPVVEGSVRARQDRRGDALGEQVMPVLIHGDAAFAGQGVVAETFQLSQTRAFYTGGTIHLVINNQIGFTMSDPRDSRSTSYCSDIAKMIEAPVLHVNGDDPEAAVAAIRLALRYRQTFHKDVVIDLVGYRRLGHNEADEPSATQPVMYSAIREHPSTRTLYGRKLAETGAVTQESIDQLAEGYRNALDEGRNPNQAALGMIGNQYTVDWSRYTQASLADSIATGLPEPEIARLAALVNTVPAEHKLHPRVQRIMDDRRRMAAGEIGCDWGFAETLAYASLLSANFHVRLIGQDSRRGTFFHRHAALIDQTTGDAFVPLAHVSSDPRALTITDSLLSEEAVLGFEYGYSTTSPGHARDLGSSVRRFRERRAGRDRSVHQLGRSEVGPALGAHDVPAARLRRPRPRAFLGAARTIPAAVRRAQHAGRRAVDSGANVPHAAPADGPAGPQAARRAHAEEPAAPQAIGVGARRSLARPLSSDDRGSGADGRRVRRAHRVLQRQGLLRPRRIPPQREFVRRRARADRGAISVSDRRVCSHHRALQERKRDRLVPGRAAESGRLVSDPASPAGAAFAVASIVLRRAARRCRTRVRHPRAARAPAASLGFCRAGVFDPRARGTLDGRQARLRARPPAKR